MASSINEKQFAMSKRRLDGSDLDDGKKCKKVKPNRKDDHGHPPASLAADQSLAVKAEIIPRRTLAKRELRELKNPKKQDFKLVHKQKPAEATEVRLTPANRLNKFESNRIPYQLEFNNAKHEERKLNRERVAEALKPRNKALESAGGQTRRRKFIPDAKNDQDISDKYSWALSDAVGGQMLDLDPIFSLNEE